VRECGLDSDGSEPGCCEHGSEISGTVSVSNMTLLLGVSMDAVSNELNNVAVMAV
jgi:hypothetical protein